MYRYLEANVGVIALPKDEMQRVKQVQRLHKEEKFSPDEVAQTLGVSAEKAAQLIGYETKALSVSALSGDDSDDDPLTWLLLDQHALTPEQAVYRQVCTEELERLFRTLSAKDCACLKLRIPGFHATLIFMVKLRQAGRHLSTTRSRCRDDNKRAPFPSFVPFF